MLGPAVVQRTKDMIDLIIGRLVVAQDGHKKCNNPNFWNFFETLMNSDFADYAK